MARENVRGESIDAAPDALEDPRAFYDARFSDEEYMRDFSTLYEECRRFTIEQVLRQIERERPAPKAILDYGCGEGRYLDVLRGHFPAASFHGSDISSVALDIARENRPWGEYTLMEDEEVPLEAGAFDLVLSVEVLEHVADVERATREIGRLTAPGGTVLISTPCANKGSLEWALNRLRGDLQTTADGYARFGTDEPGHLRRLNDAEMTDLLASAGVRVDRILHGAHLFTTAMAELQYWKRLPWRARTTIARRSLPFEKLDWRLFRRLPNGATMIVVGTKR